jgi:hypothetical protein
MLRKLIIASATLAALTAPTLAASNWNVIRPTAGAPTKASSSPCFVAERNAATGEERIAGPYGSQALGHDAMLKNAACIVQDDNHK